jgi:hypothetical protein
MVSQFSVRMPDRCAGVRVVRTREILRACDDEALIWGYCGSALRSAYSMHDELERDGNDATAGFMAAIHPPW